MTYFDTGVLLKLYTTEPESDAVRRFVTARGVAIPVTDLHLSEATCALRLKQFRRECTEDQAGRAIACIDEDLAGRILRLVPLDWPSVWARCQTLVRTESARHGTRTLDALHVAAALFLHATEFITSDTRQSSLASACGLRVVDPTHE